MSLRFEFTFLHYIYLNSGRHTLIGYSNSKDPSPFTPQVTHKGFVLMLLKRLIQIMMGEQFAVNSTKEENYYSSEKPIFLLNLMVSCL